MRWSAGVFVALIGLVLVAGPGCRNIPTENNDRNRPPETYLTAAPVDSIAGGSLTRIPHRFRAQWSGADVDGEVVGFYVAVTETTVDQSSGRPFRLPPPKPSQYRFTTSRESLFTFSVLEGRGTDREHGLYVFAVDNQGKVDPTPAVTHFVARDQNLPRVRFIGLPPYNGAYGEGTKFVLMAGGGVIPTDFRRALTDSFELPLHAPIDTIPSGGTVHFQWDGYDLDFGSSITGYLFKLLETDFVRVGAEVTSADYGPLASSPANLPSGLNVFRIRAIDEAGGTTQPDGLRQFFVNFSPDTWISGLDPVQLAPYLMTDSVGIYLPADANGNLIPFPGNILTDSTLLLTQLPAERPVTDGLDGRPKTFIERRTRLDRSVRYYVRSEGDTVAYGAGLYLRFGGLDVDSKYNVRGGSPNFGPDSLLLRSGPANGSPVAFQARVVALATNGGATTPPFSTAFPNIDPLDPLNNTDILYFADQITQTGTGYVQARSVDGDRTADLRIGDPVREVPEFDACIANPMMCRSGLTQAQARALRSKVISFPLNRKPGLLVFSPLRNDVVNPGSNRFNVVFRLTDPDPDPANPTLSANYLTMYFSVRVRVYAAGETPGPEEDWQDPFQTNILPDPTFFPYTAQQTLEIVVPPTLPEGPAVLEIEVADNLSRSQARIINVPIPFYWRVGP